MTATASISVIIPHNVTEQQFSSLLDDLRSGHIEAVIIQRKTQEYFASLDWLSTGIFIFIATSFFTGMFSKMGENALDALKNKMEKNDWDIVKIALGKLWGKFFGPEPEIKMLRVGPGGIIKNTIFFNSLSFKAETVQGTTWTLVLLNETSQEDFNLANEKFGRLMLSNHATHGADPLSVLLESWESPLKHLQQSIYLDSTSKKLVLIDPVQTSIQKTPTGYEIPEP